MTPLIPQIPAPSIEDILAAWRHPSTRDTALAWAEQNQKASKAKEERK